MKNSPLLLVTLAVLAILGVSGVAAQLGLLNDGIEFPDGTVQTSAAGTPGQFVQASATFGIPDLSFCALGDLYTVPTGKRLRIDWVAVELSEFGANDYGPVDLDIRTWLSGSQVAHPLPRIFGPLFVGESLSGTARIAGPVTIYSQGDQTVQIFACRNSDSDETSVLTTFHGQLFDE